jgi:hypothetical protein
MEAHGDEKGYLQIVDLDNKNNFVKVNNFGLDQEGKILSS